MSSGAVVSSINVPDAFDALTCDVEAAARAIFPDERNARKIMAAMHSCVAELRSLRDAQPFHAAWTRVVLLAALLTSGTNSNDSDVRSACLRLERFLEENADLLDLGETG